MSRLPVEFNTGFICGANVDPEDIPQKFRGSRVRWVIHPEKTESGTCEECRPLAGKFYSIDEITAIQPVHINCVCGFELEPAPGVESNYSAREHNPELWNKAIRTKKRAFQDHPHDH